MEQIISDAVYSVLRRIRNKRFFENERGFQGEFTTILATVLGINLPNNTIIEEEHQKILRIHGLKLRPDIVIHIPYHEITNPDRKSGNFIVFALKKRSSEKIAIEEFEKLDKMIKILNYKLGVYINIDSEKTFYENCVVDSKDKIMCFAVKGDDNENIVIRKP